MTATEGTAIVHDYVIVGAGASGAALAGKLSEDGSRSVLLLEAGGADTKPDIHIPAAFSGMYRTAVDWNYDTVPQPNVGGRNIFWPRGKVLGGSSSINAMMWVRGFAADYDSWAEKAGDEWSYRSLLPYFRSVERVEGNTDPDQGSGGAVSISKQRSPRSHTATFLEAVKEAGYAVVAPNTATPDGFSQTMVSQKRGKRFSSADAYLKPAKGRTNLTVVTGAHATRVVFDGTRAVGVEYLVGGVKRIARAAHEVVLCGGAVNTPQLLMLSGIGDAAELQKHGIPVLVDSQEVGKNLRDHLIAGLVIETAGDTLFTAKKIPQVVNFLARGLGMLTSNIAEAYGFVRSRPELELPDIEIIFAPVAFIDQGQADPPSHALTIGAILLQPESSGTISLASANPLDKALIDPRYLSDPDGRDRAALMSGLAACEDILRTPVLSRSHGTHFLAPEGGERLDQQERDELTVNEYSHTLYHPVGTARMGSDAASVVDTELRVRGVTGLRVADASVMPGIIRGHTQAPSMVIGEKAADLLMAAERSEVAVAAAYPVPVG
jgi:choline dehydrogenase